MPIILRLTSLLEIVGGSLSAPNGGALWSDAKFGPAMLDPPPIDLAVTAKDFDLWPQMSGHDAKFDLAIFGGRADLALALHHATMTLGAGTLAADLTFRRNGTSAASSGHLKLSGYDLVLPSVRGALSADLDLAGTGDSPAAIIAGLAGSGTLTLSDAVLPRTDPEGMVRVFKAVESDTLSLDADEIARAISAELEKGASHLGDVTFRCGLGGGRLASEPEDDGGEKSRPRHDGKPRRQRRSHASHARSALHAHAHRSAEELERRGADDQFDLDGAAFQSDPQHRLRQFHQCACGARDCPRQRPHRGGGIRCA